MNPPLVVRIGASIVLCSTLGNFGPSVASAQLTGACQSTVCVSVFDDFAYSSTSIGASASDNSIFGANYWCNVLPSCTGSTLTRAWYFYNWEDAYGQFAQDAISFNGSYVRLRLDNLVNPVTVPGLVPAIISGFTRKTGTWSARVRFATLPSPDYPTIQAFWLNAPLTWSTESDPSGGELRTTELDIEWNNAFGPGSGDRVHTSTLGWDSVGNHSVAQTWLNCEYIYPTGQGYSVEDIAGCDGYTTGSESPGIVGDTWWDLIIRFDGTIVEFGMQADGYGGQLGTVWGGGPGGSVGTTTSGTMVEMSEFEPQWPANDLATAFSQHWYAGSAPIETQYLDVEWFYYSTRSDISIDDIQEEVATVLRPNSVVRFTDIGTLVRAAGIDDEYSASILAPYSIWSPPAELSVDVSPLAQNTYHYAWSRRYRKPDLSWTPWQDLSDNRPWIADYSPIKCSSYTAAEYKVAVDVWWGTALPATDTHTVWYDACQGGAKRVVTESAESEQPVLSPNPARGRLVVSFSVSTDARVSLRILDARGRAVLNPFSGYLPRGDTQIPILVDNLPSGVYFLRMQIDGSDPSTTSFVLLR